MFTAFMKDESGATAIEYGLLAALISIAAIAAMAAVGTSLSSTFSNVASWLVRRQQALRTSLASAPKSRGECFLGSGGRR